MSFPVPANEIARLKSLLDLDIRNSPTSPAFDAVTRLVSDMLDCPIALISLVGQDEQWFISNHGLEVDGTSRDDAFCSHTIIGNVPLVVDNVREDVRFSNNPLVTGDPNIGFYAGVPISIDGVHNLGTLCAIDTKPRELTSYQLDTLKQLACIVEGLIATFRNEKSANVARELASAKQLENLRIAALLDQVTAISGVGGWELTLKTNNLTWTTETKKIHDLPPDYVPTLDAAIEFYEPASMDLVSEAVQNAAEHGTGWDLELQLRTALNRKIWVRAVGQPNYFDGSIVSIVGAFQDITAQKHANEVIKNAAFEAQNKTSELRAILDNMNEGVSVYDAHANLVMWNQKFIDFFDRPTDEVTTGKSLGSILAAEVARGDITGEIPAYLKTIGKSVPEHPPSVRQNRTKTGKILNSTLVSLPDGGWVGTHLDVTTQVLDAERVEYASLHDPLTGLFNRLAFTSRMETLRDAGSGPDNTTILMLLDLDEFKAVNDTYGHAVGDELLKAVACRLNDCFSETQLAARLGGDEFAFVVECKSDEAEILAQTMAMNVQESLNQPITFRDVVIVARGTMGIYLSPSDDIDIELMMLRADAALYNAKNSGGGGYELFDQRSQAVSSILNQKSVAIRAAVDANSLELNFQPIYDLKTHEICGAEALIRWRGTNFKDLGAGELVEIAEKNGAINKIGLWVLHQGIRAASTWKGDLRVAINVSPMQLGQGTLPDQIQYCLDRWNFPASRLELEITENLPMNAFESFLELKKIQALGVKIVLDDFGTGYASLSYLQRFPFDKLKIDQSFIIGSNNDRTAHKIVRSIVSLADSLGMETTAEGIETSAKLNEIAETGCIFGQGYHLARPMTANAFLSLKTSISYRSKVHCLAT